MGCSAKFLCYAAAQAPTAFCGHNYQRFVFCLQVTFIGKRLPYVLAAVSADGFLRLWNVKQVQLVMEVQVSQHSGLTAVCVDPAQTLLVVSDSAGFMYTYSIAAWKGGKGKYQVSLFGTAQA